MLEPPLYSAKVLISSSFLKHTLVKECVSESETIHDEEAEEAAAAAETGQNTILRGILWDNTTFQTYWTIRMIRIILISSARKFGALMVFFNLKSTYDIFLEIS